MNYKKQYNKSRKFSDKYLDSVKTILSNVLKCKKNEIIISPDLIDMREAADLIICGDTKEENVYVAVRIRKSKFAHLYPYDFTIRYEYTAGYKTEYEKIMEGYGDIMVYGFIEDNRINRWLLIDLEQFRKEAEKDYIIKEHKQNKDGRNSFLAFDIRSFKGKIILSNSVNYFNV